MTEIQYLQYRRTSEQPRGISLLYVNFLSNRKHYFLIAQFILAVILLCPPGVPAQTNTFHSLEDISSTAERFVISLLNTSDTDLSVSAKTLDPRLRLKACDVPLQAFLPDFSRPGMNTTVGVKCEGTSAWSLYVPVKSVFNGAVVVLKQPISRGTVLTTAHLKLEERNLGNRSQDYYTDISAVVGKMAKRPIQAGKILSSVLLQQPKLVKRGETVTMLASIDSVKVSMNGQALMDGHEGQRIRVKNLRSQRIVEGIVKSDRIIYLD